MIFIYVTIAALATTALAKGAMECNVSEPTQKCFGALSEPLIFYLPTRENTKVMLTKNNKILYSVGTIDQEYNHSAFFTNAMFKLDKATKKDSGDYQLETYAADGVLLHKISFHREIQAPMSRPAVSQMCLSPEQMNISCSSEGDGVQFILTLDGLLLMQTRAHSQSQTNWTADSQSLAGNAAKQDKFSVSTVSISLYGQLTGNLTCQVMNNVSRDKTVLQLGSCKASISHLSHVTTAVIASVATLLLILALFLGMKHLTKKLRTMTVNEGHAEDEIIYSDVRVMKNTRKPRSNSHQNAIFS